MKKIIGFFMIFSFLFASLNGMVFALGEGDQGIDFNLTSTKGEKVSLSGLKGKKVLLDFFATWCPPCKEELKSMSKIIKERPNRNFEIICISVDNAMGTVQKFMEEKQYKMLTLFDDKNVANQYGVQGIPTLFLVDETGKVIWKHVGLASERDMLRALGEK